MPPVVVSTVPVSGALDVDPAITELKVTFSKEMLDKSWSCVNLSEASFPSVTGKLRYEEDKRTLVIPVKLEAGKAYAIWINSEKDKNFKDLQGLSAIPYLLIFETKE